MSRFYGSFYCRYKDKDTVIGVCNPIGRFMIGHVKPTGSLRRVKILPLFDSTEEGQKCLDEFAATRGLTEVQA